MSLLRPRPVSINKFLRTEGMLVAEDSDLGGTFGRVYDDACDVGLTVCEPNGLEIVYAIDHEERRDGDILWWDLLPARPDWYAHVTPVRIFND